MPPLDKNTHPAGHSEIIETGITTMGKAPNEKQCIVHWHDEFVQQDSAIKKAVTKVTVLQNRKLCSFLALEPITGRKHQLRLHCASEMKSFILGDFKYGPGFTKEYQQQLTRADRKSIFLHLHLFRIKITDWYGLGKHLVVTAPLSDRWARSAKSAGIDIMLSDLLHMDDILIPQKRRQPTSVNWQDPVFSAHNNVGPSQNPLRDMTPTSPE